MLHPNIQFKYMTVISHLRHEIQNENDSNKYFVIGKILTLVWKFIYLVLQSYGTWCECYIYIEDDYDIPLQIVRKLLTLYMYELFFNLICMF